MKVALTRLNALAAKEIRLLMRDRHGLLVLFAMPAAFILIMSLALQNVFESHRSGSIVLTLVDGDGAPLARQFTARLRSEDQFRLLAPGDRDAESAALRITLLPGFSELLATRYDFAEDYRSGKPEPALLRLDFSKSLPASMRAVLEMAVRQAVIAVQSDYLLSTVLERPAEEMRTLRYLLDPMRVPLGAPPDAPPLPTAVQQSVPAWLIFALFFTVIPLSTSFVVERQQGTLVRLLALGIPATLLFGAKAIAYYCVNVVQIATMLLIGAYVVPLLGGEGLRFGGHVAGLWLIGSATSLASIGLSLLVAVNVRSILQATAVGGALCLLMGAVGGIMVPAAVMPLAMQRAAGFSPMAWSLDGFLSILLPNGSTGELLRESGLLIGFALACLLAAAVSIRRRSLLHSTHT